MYLSPEEKETHISLVEIDSDGEHNEVWEVYTSQSKMMRRIEKLGIQPIKEDYDRDGDLVAKTYKIPYKQIQFVKQRKKAEISEERRQQLKEHMAKIQEKRLNK